MIITPRDDEPAADGFFHDESADDVHVEPVYEMSMVRRYKELAKQYVHKKNKEECSQNLVVAVQHYQDIALDWRIRTNRIDIS